MGLSPTVIFNAAGFGLLAAIAASVADCRLNRIRFPAEENADKSNVELRSLRRTYLAGYLLATMADWLQGPYIFVLYESYGFSKRVCTSFFIVGFGSSTLFGTFLGMRADQCGRKRFAVVYCILYILTCLTKHIDSYVVLVVGHSAAGAAVSLLYCVFDSWLVAEHNSNGFEKDALANTFSIAALGNSIIAIAAGEIGEVAANFKTRFKIADRFYMAGYCSPFDVAVLFLCGCIVVMLGTWHENRSHISTHDESNFLDILDIVFKVPAVLACGIVCASFEASMFIFVVYWTPALQQLEVPDPPFGHIFAVLMIMCMVGSRLFSVASHVISIELIGLFGLILAAASHMAVGLTTDRQIRFFGFLMFETSVGIYWPMMNTLKSRVVPEDARSAIYSLYRVPLNITVLTTLLCTSSVQQSFFITSLLLVVACFAQLRLFLLARKGVNESTYSPVPVFHTALGGDTKDVNGAQIVTVIGKAETVVSITAELGETVFA